MLRGGGRPRGGGWIRGVGARAKKRGRDFTWLTRALPPAQDRGGRELVGAAVVFAADVRDRVAFKAGE